MLVFARKYRPKKISDLVGQPAVAQTIKNAITNKRLHHAYLFVGKYGSGKCVSPDTLVSTDVGLRRISSFFEVGDNGEISEGHQPVEVFLDDEDFLKSGKRRLTLDGYHEKQADTFIVTTREGFEIEATPEHPLRVWTPDGLKWIKVSDIQEGYFIPIVRKSSSNTCPSDSIDWDFNSEKYLKDRFGSGSKVQCGICKRDFGNLCTHIATHNISTKEYKSKFPGPLVAPDIVRASSTSNIIKCAVPKRFTKSIARLFGYVVSEGHVNDKCVGITNSDDKIIADIQDTVNREFSINAHITRDRRTKNTQAIRMNSIQMVEFFRYYGMGGKSCEKKVPDVVFGWSDELIFEFLRAYFDGDGGIDGPSVSCSSRSKRLILDLQSLLLTKGILSFVASGLKGAKNGKNIKRPVWVLRIYSENVHFFAQKIGFLSQEKQDALSELISSNSFNPNKDIIPFLQDDMVSLKKKLAVNPNGYLMVDGKNLGKFRWPGNVRSGFEQHKNITYDNLRECTKYFKSVLSAADNQGVVLECQDEIKQLINKGTELISLNFFFSPVQKVIQSKNDVFDVCKNGDDHSFIANGMINHNTSLARILAASENCKVSPGLDPCGSCDICKSIFVGDHADVIEIDAASNAGKVDQIRELKRSANYCPIDGAKTKYFIIDEVHAMSSSAEESLLKLIEEPPSHVRFVLCTTELQRMRGTILSRCQIHDFKQIYWREMVLYLQNVVKSEKIECDENALNLCAKLADGSLRNALQNLEKLVDFAGTNTITIQHAQSAFGAVSDVVFYNLLDQAIGEGGPPDATRGYKIINELLVSGLSFDVVCDGILETLRNILIGVTTTACGDLISVSEECKKRLIEQMKRCKSKMPAVLASIKGLAEAKRAVQFGISPDVALQMWFLDSIFAFQK